MHNTFISNYHGFPEDCPAREKCGWLGDAEVVCNYGLLNYDSTSAYEKYLEDILTTYETYGVWQMIAPGKRTAVRQLRSGAVRRSSFLIICTNTPVTAK